MRLPRRFFLCVALAALLLGGCASVPVTPARLQNSRADPALAQGELATWNQAVFVCNEFLKSAQRHTLPAGSFALDEQGMVYSYPGGSIRLTIKCTTFGDVLVHWNMVAQERSWGFVVGRTRPGASRLTDNSLFRQPNGAFQSNIDVAGTILHETTHIYTKDSLDNPWDVIRYYAEACFLFRYRTHSMERQPFRTTAEFSAFIAATRQAHPEWFSPTPPNPPSQSLPAPASL